MKKGKSWEHAPTPEGFNKLLEAAKRTNRIAENMFLLILAGIYGLRSGEIAHIKLSWFDFKQGLILIPSHEPCDCVYCRVLAKKRTKNPSLTPQEVREIYWQPKREASVRAVPYKLKPYRELAKVVEEVITKYGRYPRSVKNSEQTLHRLIVLAGNIRSAYGKNIYLHGLRAFASTRFAYANLSLWRICNVMGWKDIETASSYLAKLGFDAVELNDGNNYNERSFLFTEPCKFLGENKENVKELSFEEGVWLKRYLKNI